MTSALTLSILADSRVAQVAVYKNSDSLAEKVAIGAKILENRFCR